VIGTPLAKIRDHIKLLASNDGEYYPVCTRYGDRPVPGPHMRMEFLRTRRTGRLAASTPKRPPELAGRTDKVPSSRANSTFTPSRRQGHTSTSVPHEAAGMVGVITVE